MVISRDVIFYEISMIKVLAPKESSVETVERVDKQVEFETSLVPNSDEQECPYSFSSIATVFYFQR